MNDPLEWAKHIGALVKGHVERAFGVLDERVKALESRPAPKDGEPGRDGDSATPEAIRAAVEAHLIENPPAAGKDGDRGESGPAPTPEAIAAAVEEHLKANPPAPGKDGASVSLDEVKGLLDGMAAAWALDFERRAQETLQRSIDRIPLPRDGTPGKDGRDAFELDDVDLTLDDDGRTVRLKFVRGEHVREKTVTLSTLLDRGVFKQGEKYVKGDCVSWGGSLFVAQTDTGATPDQSTDWRLAVKRGRDGNRGRDATIKTAEPYRLRQ